MKVFIGTKNITDSARLLQQGFQMLGLEADVALLGEKHKFYADTIKNSIDIEKLYSQTKISLNEDGSLSAVAPMEFQDVIKKYDIFVFIASHSLLPHLVDLKMLQLMGKKIVCYQTGSELRHESTAVPFWSAYGHEFPRDVYKIVRDYNGKIVPFYNSTPFTHSFINKMYNTRMAEQYATTICTTPAANNLGIRPYMVCVLPMEKALCKFRIPRRKIPLVVHAPSNRAFKRTDIVLRTLDELAEEGIPFRLCLLEQVDNAKVLEVLSEADILIDQIACGSVGRLGLEGFCSGCAVISGNSAAIPWPPHRPALSVTPGNFKDRVREVLTNSRLRLQLAAAGREYIEKGYHSPQGAAQAILDAVEREKEKDFDYYPTVFFEKAVASPEEFMPPFLRRLMFEIMKRHGIAPDTVLERLEREGFLPEGVSGEAIPRWDMSHAHKIGPWNWCAKRIPVPDFETVYIDS